MSSTGAGGHSVGIGIITGVGLALTTPDAEEIDVATPYGPTSVPVQIGTLGGRRVAYLNRRGDGDVLQPHLVPYRANVWALAAVGARALLTTTAAGGLRDSFPPGVFVVTDQIIDRTHGREITFYDEGPAVQLTAPEPFDPTLRSLAVEALATQRVRFRDFATAVVINGPRFSTRAESRWHAASGGDIVTTSLMPETTLALELNMAVANVSFITDADAGTMETHADAASADLVRRRVAQARPVLGHVLTEVVRRIPAGFRVEGSIPQDAVTEVLARRAD